MSLSYRQRINELRVKLPQLPPSEEEMVYERILVNFPEVRPQLESILEMRWTEAEFTLQQLDLCEFYPQVEEIESIKADLQTKLASLVRQVTVLENVLEVHPQ
jgi:hypothetical protein